MIAFIAERGIARRILDHLGMPTLASPLARARAPEVPAGSDPGADDHAGEPDDDH